MMAARRYKHGDMGSLVGKPGGHADAQQLKQGVNDRQAVDPAGRVSK